MSGPKDDIEVTEIEIGYSQAYRPNPLDQYLISHAHMNLRAVVVPGVMDETKTKNALLARCQAGVQEFIQAEMDKAEQAMRDEEKFQ